MPRHLTSKNFPLHYEKPVRIKNPSFPTLFVTVLAITIPHTRFCTQDSQIGTPTTLRDERRWNLNSILSWCLDLSRLHSGQNGSDGHPASHATNTRVLSQEVKQPGHQSDHSPTSALRLSTVDEWDNGTTHLFGCAVATYIRRRRKLLLASSRHSHKTAETELRGAVPSLSNTS